jgi:hypothetical protein
LAQRSRKRGRRERPAGVPGEAGAGPAGAAVAPPTPAGGPPATTGPSAAKTGATSRQTTTTRERPPARAPRPAHAGRSEERNAAVRATLTPLAPGERPIAITVSAAITALLGAGNLIAFLAGAEIGGKHPAAAGIIVFSVLMFVCSVGLWKMWYGAVLGFMVLLAIVICLFALLLVEASNLLGFLVPPVIIGGAGFLFMKLVRTLSRIQMPKAPSP